METVCTQTEKNGETRIVMIIVLCYDENLILVKENKTWEDALEQGRSLDTMDTDDPASSYWIHSYDLSSLITPDDHTTAQEATTDEVGQFHAHICVGERLYLYGIYMYLFAYCWQVWTGLCNLAGEWLWVGGEQVQYEDLPNCPTNGFCGVFEKNSTEPFAITNCQQKRNFLCYRSP